LEKNKFSSLKIPLKMYPDKNATTHRMLDSKNIKVFLHKCPLCGEAWIRARVRVSVYILGLDPRSRSRLKATKSG
jgi:hypothetical protein